ncbi:FAD:protein FMN transferase [Nocardioides marmorisolisilvae]|uniref:FAD:protein FMN transferase n=1 Tax=Nocardioides marmorisolisilvae TaxID=1542737 RepID=A0A3N0DPF4_9ACTN|nr:FAD:protein FMN transferase [Nocardioides marmorisolisilvae]RNL77530.1 FAD:protein FMN transferase [Nocardioides marmorisolisilvae]
MTTPVRYVEQVMGMPISLALRGRWAGTPVADRAWGRVVDSLRAVDAVFSTYRSDSWVSRLGRGEVTVQECPAMVGEVLVLAEQARLESGGAFDVWSAGSEEAGGLDPSGVVKGWAVQRAVAELDVLEDTDVCLSAGGDLVCVTRRPDADPWRIGIEDPHDPSRVIAVVPVLDGGVATSGLAHRGAHIVDPRTGRTPSELASITVVGDDLTWADIDATAAFVMGASGIDWLTARGRTGVAVLADGSARTFAPTDR